MILCVGATGLLGQTLVKALISENLEIRCLVRESSDISKIEGIGAEIVVTDFKDTDFLDKTIAGADTVISTFSTNIARHPEVRGLWDNDYTINFELIKLAKKNRVRKFIYTSYWGLAKFGYFEHGMIKKMVEDLLVLSGMDYTVLRITSLATDMSLLLGASLKKKGFAPVLMKKRELIRPILLDDLAGCISASIDNRKASKKIIEVAGREVYDFLQLQNLFSESIGKKVRLVFVPLFLAHFISRMIDSLTHRKYNAQGLVSAFTGGSTCDISEMDDVFKLKQGSFKEYLTGHFRESHQDV